MGCDAMDIAERAKHLRRKGTLPEGAGCGETQSAEGDNPFCGDSLRIEVKICRTEGTDGAVVADARFDGYACSLCTAAADELLCRAVGMRVKDALALAYEDVLGYLGNPAVGRTRSGCVRLPLTVLHRALETEG